MGRSAAIDLGTNCTRLLVRRRHPGALDRRSIITRLGRGVDAAAPLGAEPVAATLAVLRDFRTAMDHLGVVGTCGRWPPPRCATPPTARPSWTRPRRCSGVAPELLSGSEEGELAFAGATAGLDGHPGPYLVVDIGGGSTEFVVGQDRPEGLISVDMGAVRLTEAHLQSDPPAPEELSNALAVVEAHLEDVVREVPAVVDARTVIGVAGTVTTVAAVEIGLDPYDRDRIHRFWLTRDAAEDVFRTLATEALADRVHNPGLHPDRADVIVGGCCVLVGTMRRLGLHGILVSESDLLDALADRMLRA